MVHQDEAGTFPVLTSTDTQGGKALEPDMQVRTCYLCFFFSSLLAKENRALSVLPSAPHHEVGEEESQWEQGASSSNHVTWVGAAAMEITVLLMRSLTTRN